MYSQQQLEFHKKEYIAYAFDNVDNYGRPLRQRR